MKELLIKKLDGIGLLSKQVSDLGNVTTGCYALNKIISDDYNKGIPIGMITQFIGESSTAKTAFALQVLKGAQDQGYYPVLIDSENAINRKFAESFGVSDLFYAAPPTMEECFEVMQTVINEIRETDKNTPIVFVYDSIAASPTKKELDLPSFDMDNMIGAVRAKIAGNCLKRINTLLRGKKVALVIINQFRSKVIAFGNPNTQAGGGRSLPYWLGVDLTCKSNKTSDLVKDERGKTVGIRGKVQNTKNKVGHPYQECAFELLYGKGLTKTYGLLELLEIDGYVNRSGAWYSITEGGEKFQSKNFVENLETNSSKGWETLRNLLDLSCK